MSIASLNSAGGPLLALGYPGQIADDQECSIMSRINESTTGGTSTATPGMMDFGIAVSKGTNPGCCKIIAQSELPIGITVRNPVLSPDGLNNMGYAPTTAVGIMYLGDIFCTAYETVTDGDEVLALTAQGGQLGGITGGPANSSTRLVVPGAQWVAEIGQTTITAGTIGRVRLTGTSNPRTSS